MVRARVGSPLWFREHACLALWIFWLVVSVVCSVVIFVGIGLWTLPEGRAEGSALGAACVVVYVTAVLAGVARLARRLARYMDSTSLKELLDVPPSSDPATGQGDRRGLAASDGAAAAAVALDEPNDDLSFGEIEMSNDGQFAARRTIPGVVVRNSSDCVADAARSRPGSRTETDLRI